MKRWKTYYPNAYSAQLDEEIEVVEAAAFDAQEKEIERLRECLKKAAEYMMSCYEKVKAPDHYMIEETILARVPGGMIPTHSRVMCAQSDGKTTDES